MPKTPWQYAETGTEYSHQVALFQWCNMAASFGLSAANDEASYIVAGIAKKHFEKYHDRVPQLTWLYANKNAVGRNSTIAGARNAAEGVKAGVPDLFLPAPMPKRFDVPTNCFYHGLYIELKRPASNEKAKGRVDVKQENWCAYLRHAGFAVEVCYGWASARETLLNYLGRNNGNANIRQV